MQVPFRLAIIFSCWVLMVTMADASGETDFERRCHAEVVALHQTIEGWLAGRLPDTDDAYRRFEEAMGENFEIISPSGVRSERGAIVASLRGAHGVQGAGFTITIKNLRTRLLRPPLALVTYEEWQTVGDKTTARFSSVLLRDDDSRPGGVAWVHLQETWLPGRSPGPQAH